MGTFVCSFSDQSTRGIDFCLIWVIMVYIPNGEERLDIVKKFRNAMWMEFPELLPLLVLFSSFWLAFSKSRQFSHLQGVRGIQIQGDIALYSLYMGNGNYPGRGNASSNYN